MPLDALESLLLEHSVLTGSFVLASGETSDVYVDVRKTALRGDGALAIGRAFIELLDQHAPHAVAAGGLTLGADPLVTATAIAASLQDRDVAAVIVRKEAKGHGTGKRIEQPREPVQGDEIVAVDDVVTSAGSTIRAIEALRSSGYAVNHAFCVVDRQAGGRQALADIGVKLHALFSLDELVTKKRAG